MQGLQFHYKNALPFIEEQDFKYISEQIETVHHKLHTKSGSGNDYLGWLDWPENYDRKEFDRIEKTAEKIKAESDVLLVIGIGGSYLGAKAAIDMLNHSFFNLLEKHKRKAPEIIFVGHHLNGTYIAELLDYLEDKSVSINVISKSGTTTEPAIAFRIFRKFLEEKYGIEQARGRIYVTTDKQKGALKQLAAIEGYETFSIPDNIGGRYSVLTPVGMLPISVSGINIQELMQGAYDAMIELQKPFEENPAYQYAAIRNLLYSKGKAIELLVNDKPNMMALSEWWKQLFGESEGKNGKGIFPASANFTTDLHSFGQYIQDGTRNLFETFVLVKKPREQVKIEACQQNIDNLNYIAGNTVDYVNKKAIEATITAHSDGGVPNMTIAIPELTPYHVGYLFYFFKKACAASGYLLDVNPFDQPGVEAYKTNMFRLLGKPGY